METTCVHFFFTTAHASSDEHEFVICNHVNLLVPHYMQVRSDGNELELKVLDFGIWRSDLDLFKNKPLEGPRRSMISNAAARSARLPHRVQFDCQPLQRLRTCSKTTSTSNQFKDIKQVRTQVRLQTGSKTSNEFKDKFNFEPFQRHKFDFELVQRLWTSLKASLTSNQFERVWTPRTGSRPKRDERLEQVRGRTGLNSSNGFEAERVLDSSNLFGLEIIWGGSNPFGIEPIWGVRTPNSNSNSNSRTRTQTHKLTNLNCRTIELELSNSNSWIRSLEHDSWTRL